jgi:hypothetical protein
VVKHVNLRNYHMYQRCSGGNNNSLGLPNVGGGISDSLLKFPSPET